MKKFISLMLSLVLVISLAGCGKDIAETAEESTEPAETTTEETKAKATKESTKETTAETTAETTVETTEATDKPVNAGTLSDDLYDFTIALNDVVYTLPCLYTEIETNGWKGDFGAETMDPGYYDIVNAKNGDVTMCFDLANLGVDTIAYADGYIGGLTYGILENDKGCTLELAKGITYGSAKDEVIAAYGEPTNIFEGDSYTTLAYEADTYSTYKFMINNENGLVENIAIKNLVVVESSEPAAASGEVPAVVATYKAPTEKIGRAHV